MTTGEASSETLTISQVDVNVSFASENENQPEEVKKSVRGKAKNWLLLKEYDNDTGAEKFLKSEKTWSKVKQQDTHTVY